MLRFLLVLLIVYLIIRIFSRYFIRRYAKNMQQNFEDRQNRYNKRKEGDVTIKTNSANNKKFKKDEGDYVDFEEIK